jgi:nucleoid-associated protein YgaU
MSKDLAIAGVIVLSCLAVTAIAFITPTKSQTDTQTVAMADTITNRPTPVIEPSRPPEPPSADLAGQSPSFEDVTSLDLLNTTEAPLVAQGGGDFVRQPTVFTPSDLPIPSGNLDSIQSDPPSLPAQADPAQPRVHTVVSGEMLGDISLKYYGTTRHWKAIRDANKVNPDNLKIGQKLDIPVIEKSASSAVAATTAAAVPAVEGGQRLYTVKEGDSYYQIAARELGTPSRFKELERLNAGSEDLRVGMVIKLPARNQAPDAAEVKPAAVAATPGKVHIIGADETLSDLSIKYFGTSTRWREIQQANPGIDPNSLRVGQKITIPSKDLPSAPVEAAPASEIAAVVGDTRDIDYVVRSNDTMESLAQKYYGSGKEWRRIHKDNPGVDPNFLRVGQKLKIRGIAVAAEPAVESKPPQAPETLGKPSPFAPPAYQADPGPAAPQGADQTAPAQQPTSSTNPDEVFKDFFPK